LFIGFEGLFFKSGIAKSFRMVTTLQVGLNSIKFEKALIHMIVVVSIKMQHWF